MQPSCQELVPPLADLAYNLQCLAWLKGRTAPA